MSTQQIIIAVLAGYGFTNAVVNTKLFEWLRRRLPNFATCAACVGFWAGLNYVAFVLDPILRSMYPHTWPVVFTAYQVLCVGLLCSGFSYLIQSFKKYLEFE